MSGRPFPRVMHVITGLDIGGGAETLLVRLLEELGEEERRGHSVLSLRPRGTLAPEVERLDVPVDGLGMGGSPSPRDLGRFARLAREARGSGADVVHTWMLHANVLAGWTVRLTSSIPVVWGVHLSDVSRSTLGAKAVAIQRCEALSSWLVPARIVACSLSSQQVMHRLRYRRRRILTIPNGFDLDAFRPDPEVGRAVREELGLSPATTLIGHFARMHPVKGHATLLAAASQVLRPELDAKLLLCGDRVSREDPELRPLLEPLGDRVRVLGHRDDVPRILDAVDVAVSSSYSEALPLTVGEAMASAVPVLATDAGDSAELIGDTGVVVPSGDPAALARGLGELIAAGPERRAELGRRARERISSHYALGTMVARYRQVWEEAAGRARPT